MELDVTVMLSSYRWRWLVCAYLHVTLSCGLLGFRILAIW